jgi:hypothetical protein
MGLFFLPFAAVLGGGIGGVAGGIEGSKKAVPGDEAKNIEASITKAIANLNVQENLADHVASAGSDLTDKRFRIVKGQGPSVQDEKPNYSSIRDHDIDIVIEVSVNKLGFQGGEGSDPELSFFMLASVRVIRPADGVQLYLGVSEYDSRPRKVSQWARNGATPLQKEFENAYASLAEWIVEQLFLLYDFHTDSTWSTNLNCMLQPYAPPMVGSDKEFFSHKRKFSKVDSLQSTFQWEAFPRDKDRQYDKTGILTKVSEIVYDLKIWKGSDGYPDELVYERRGLVAPEELREVPQKQISPTDQTEITPSAPPAIHKERLVEYRIDMMLEPSTEYYWTVRARFKLDGQTRVTRWSYHKVLPPLCTSTCTCDYIPINGYHRFVTPKQ